MNPAVIQVGAGFRRSVGKGKPDIVDSGAKDSIGSTLNARHHTVIIAHPRPGDGVTERDRYRRRIEIGSSLSHGHCCRRRRRGPWDEGQEKCG